MLRNKWRFVFMLIMGILIAFVMRAILPLPPAFALDNPSNWYFSILQSVVITFCIWESTLWFDHYVSKRLPWEHAFFKRLLTVLTGSMLLCVSFFFTVGWFFNAYICPFPLLENENIFKISLAIAINFSVMILTVEFAIQLFYKWKASLVEIEAHKAETALAKLENLKSQINPHFLFNNMSVLTALIYKDQDKAADFVQQMSKVYRYLLDNASRELVTLKEEMEFIESYLYLLQIRYSPNLIIDQNIEVGYLNKVLPPLSIQLLLENAIKHNEISSEKPLTIAIQTVKDYLVISNVKNKRISAEESSGTGLTNIRSRYAFFTDNSVEVLDLETKFIVKIPLIEAL
jgi:sensor histidine kinase YesM